MMTVDYAIDVIVGKMMCEYVERQVEVVVVVEFANVIEAVLDVGPRWLRDWMKQDYSDWDVV